MILALKLSANSDYYMDLVLKTIIRLDTEGHTIQLPSLIFEHLEYDYDDYSIEELDFSKLCSILQQLYIDKYIHYDNENTLPDQRNYYITFKGIWFMKQDGYQGEMESRKAEKIRVETLAENQRIKASRMTYLTIILAFSTSISAVLALLEIHTSHRVFWNFVTSYYWFLIVFVVMGTILSLWIWLRKNLLKSLKDKRIKVTGASPKWYLKRLIYMWKNR